jgi:hypothetical protein
MIKRLRPLAILHLVLALCIVSVMSCDRSSNGGKAPVKIRFWNGFTGPDGREMLAGEFRAAGG